MIWKKDVGRQIQREGFLGFHEQDDGDMSVFIACSVLGDYVSLFYSLLFLYLKL